MDLNETPDYGVEKNNQQLYGDLPLSVSLVLQESNSELPAPSKSNYTLLSRQEKKIYFSRRQETSVAVKKENGYHYRSG